MILQNEFGNDGYAFWFKLLELLCRIDGQVYDYNNPAAWRLLLAETCVTEDTATKILHLLSEIEAIDQELSLKKIIWVQHLVDNLTDVYTRRRDGSVPERPVFTERFCLTCGTKLTSKRSSAKYCSEACRVTDNRNNQKMLLSTETPLLSTETPLLSTEIPDERDCCSENVNNMRQTILNHTKLNYSTAQAEPVPIRKPKIKSPYGQFRNVLLTQEEHDKLTESFKESLPEKIEALSLGIESKGYKYKSHYAALLAWDRRDKRQAGPGSSDIKWPAGL